MKKYIILANQINKIVKSGNGSYTWANKEKKKFHIKAAYSLIFCILSLVNVIAIIFNFNVEYAWKEIFLILILICVCAFFIVRYYMLMKASKIIVIDEKLLLEELSRDFLSKCPKCGWDNPDNEYRYCDECGEDLTVKK